MSEVVVRSQIRYSELIPTDPVPPLKSLTDVKTWFGITDTTLDAQLTLALDAVSEAIRNYTGRYLTFGTYTENFRYVISDKPERYLVETPIKTLTSGAELMNRKTGHVFVTGGPLLEVVYEGGYETLPADLTIVLFDLIRQQMAVWGFEEIGTAKPANIPQEKAVWLGTLKVEYAISAASVQAKSAGAGGISDAALAPYAFVLDTYRSMRRLAAT
jgi:hypothetical protein